MMKELPHSGESSNPLLKRTYSGQMEGMQPSVRCEACMSPEYLGVETRQIVTVEQRVLHQICLFLPTEFLAVRTVGEHARHVAAYRPVDDVVYLVEHGFGTDKRTRLWRGIACVQTHDEFDFGQMVPDCSRPMAAFQLHVSEPVMGELGLPNGFAAFRPCAIRREIIRQPVAFLVCRAVGFQQFAGLKTTVSLPCQLMSARMMPRSFVPNHTPNILCVFNFLTTGTSVLTVMAWTVETASSPYCSQPRHGSILYR